FFSTHPRPPRPSLLPYTTLFRSADTFVLSNLERKTANNKSTSEILQERITDLKSQIKEQEAQLLAYAKNHQILSLDAAQNTVVEDRKSTRLNSSLVISYAVFCLK